MLFQRSQEKEHRTLKLLMILCYTVPKNDQDTKKWHNLPLESIKGSKFTKFPFYPRRAQIKKKWLNYVEQIWTLNWVEDRKITRYSLKTLHLME